MWSASGMALRSQPGMRDAIWLPAGPTAEVGVDPGRGGAGQWQVVCRLLRRPVRVLGAGWRQWPDRIRDDP